MEKPKKEILNVEELKNKYNKIYEITAELEDIGEEFIFYFKAPNMASVSRYIKNVSKKQLQATTDFALENIVDEQKEYFENVIKDYIGISQITSGKLLVLLGFTDNVIAKKL